MDPDPGEDVADIGVAAGGRTPARSWALFIVDTQRSRVAGLYRHGAERSSGSGVWAASAR